MNSTSTEQTTDDYNVSATPGFTEILFSSDFLTYDGSTTDDDYNETSIVVLLSTTSSNFVTRSSSHGGSSSAQLITGVTISCITCAVILLIIVAFVVWRCRAVSQHSTSSVAVERLEAHKYGAVSACATNIH